MTTNLGRPTSLQASAIPLRKRDLRSPTKGRRMLQDSGDALYWSFYKGVPAISNYVQVLSNSADLVSYYPGVLDPDSAEPVPSEDQAVLNVWNDIGGEAAMSDWVSSLVVHLSVPGQGWFVPLTQPDVLAAPPTDAFDTNGGPPEEVKTFWQVVSTADLKRLLNLDQGQAIPEDDNRIWRIYDPDPENSKDPTSSVIRVRTHANILLLIDRRHEADLYSRIHAGVWPLPSSVKNQRTPSGVTWADLLEDGLINAAQPGAIESRVPIMLYMENEEIPLVQQPIKLAVDDGAWLLELEEKTLRSLAIGLDAPQELTTGMNTLNHWGAWLIQEETYTQHLDPLIVRILRSFNPWWRAQLEAGGLRDTEKQVLWRNPATAINRPNSFQEDLELHAAFVISDAELRASADKGDDAAPDEEEVERRIRIQQALRASPSREPTADETRNVPDTNPLQAATNESRPLALARLARRLANIDQTALLRLEAEAAWQLRRRRQSLLSRIEAAASRRSITAAADDIETLPMRLGPSVVQELIPGNLAEPDDFEEAPFVSIFASAQAEATAALATALIDRDTEADVNDRSAAGSLIAQALAAAVVTSLFRRPETRGEAGIDGSELVPMDDLRRGLDTAGGGLAQRDGLDAWEGIGNGKRTAEALSRGEIETTGFTWVYGITPRKSFEPHRDLDGDSFDSWTDPLLSQSFEADWLSGEFYFPGDHRGCRCSYVRSLSSMADTSVGTGRPDEPTPSGPALSWDMFGVKMPTDAARRTLMHEGLQRLNGLPANIRDRYVQLLGQFDGGIRFNVATASTKSISELGKVTILTDRGGVLQPHGRKLSLQLSRQTDEWDEWVVRHNEEHRFRAREVRTSGVTHRELMDQWQEANPEPTRWRLASPDELADTLVHELGHANDFQQFFDSQMTMAGHLDKVTRDKVWEMYWGGPRGGTGIRTAAYEYATTSTREMVAELQRFYLRGVHEDALDLTPEQWRSANPDLARWVEDNLLP